MTINQYLEKDKNKAAVYAKVDKELKNKIEALRKKRGVSWRELITACLKQWLKENE